jgi:DNA-binding beta-propeller fold protein YncE
VSVLIRAGACALAVATLVSPVASAQGGLVPVEYSAKQAALSLSPLGSYATGIFDESAAEIVSFDARSKRLFVVNAAQAKVEVLDARHPSRPRKLFDLTTVGVPAEDGSSVPDGAVANSVDVRADGLGVIAVESDPKTDAGWVVFFDARANDGRALGAVRVGALPDMVTFTPDGRKIVVANEGEPADDFSTDPEGSVSVISAPWHKGVARQRDVRTADFRRFEHRVPRGVRVFGPLVNTRYPRTAALEPEYVAVDRASRTAYVTLQEANAMAVVDLRSATVRELNPLGAKDHGRFGIDPSDRDDRIGIRRVPVDGLYMPDGVEAYTARGRTYLVTANEGDAREWGDYVEPARVKDLGADGVPPVCPGVLTEAELADEELGRLNVTTGSGLRADGSCFERLFSFGGRSFSIWTTDGDLVFDSGEGLERVVAAAVPEFFNSNHTESGFDGRSDDKGPEPENLAIGEIRGRTYAFVGFERVGGIAVYDITDPRRAFFVTYVNNRDFSVSVEDGGELAAAGDLGPEGVAFIPAKDSPAGVPLLAVANEVSGTTTLFRIDRRQLPRS